MLVFLKQLNTFFSHATFFLRIYFYSKQFLLVLFYFFKNYRNSERFSPICSLCMKQWVLLGFIIFMVIPSLCALPTRTHASHARKSCGRDLVERVDRICRSRGGHMTYTRAHRFRRGIVDECCMNKCADHHIFAYCSNEQPKPEQFPETIAALTSDLNLETAESRVPGASRLLLDSDNRNENVIPVEKPTTSSPIEKFTMSPNHRYHDIYVKKNVDSEFVNRLIKTLPHNSNPDFQVGTVPPEYLISRFIPSRARTTSSFHYWFGVIVVMLLLPHSNQRQSTFNRFIIDSTTFGLCTKKLHSSSSLKWKKKKNICDIKFKREKSSKVLSDLISIRDINILIKSSNGHEIMIDVMAMKMWLMPKKHSHSIIRRKKYETNIAFI